MANDESFRYSLDQLPPAVLCTIITKLDVASICSVAATCSTSKDWVSQILSFLSVFQIFDVAPSMEIMRPLLPPNPFLRSLKVDCGKLDDSAIDFMLRLSLHELCLYNCTDFSGKLLCEIGGKCKDLRSLCLGSVAEKRGRSIRISDLEELLKNEVYCMPKLSIGPMRLSTLSSGLRRDEVYCMPKLSIDYTENKTLKN